MQPARTYGPLVVTGDLRRQTALFQDVLGMDELARVRLVSDQVQELFGAEAHGLGGAEIRVLRTPRVASGAVLVQFDVPGEETIRTWDTRLHTDALKVIDFYTPNLPRVIQLASAHGFEVLDTVASYELEGGTVREAHLWGPDEVVVAFLTGPPEIFADLARVLDQPVSEVQSMSAPLSRVDRAEQFYRDVFGWRCVYSYTITDESFSRMIGSSKLDLRSRNVGTSTRDPYLGLIDYGLSEGDESQYSLAGRATVTRRGLWGVTVLVDDMREVIERARGNYQLGGRVAAPGLGPLTTVTGPHTVPHLVLTQVPRTRDHHQPTTRSGNPRQPQPAHHDRGEAWSA